MAGQAGSGQPGEAPSPASPSLLRPVKRASARPNLCPSFTPQLDDNNIVASLVLLVQASQCPVKAVSQTMAGVGLLSAGNNIPLQQVRGRRCARSLQPTPAQTAQSIFTLSSLSPHSTSNCCCLFWLGQQALLPKNREASNIIIMI